MRAGDGRIPRLWSIVTDEANVRWCRPAQTREVAEQAEAQGAAGTGVRPGPEGQPGARADVVAAPPLGAEVGEVGAVSSGARSGRRPRSSGLTSTSSPAGTACPASSTVAVVHAGRHPRRRGEAQASPTPRGRDRCPVPVVAGEVDQQPGARRRSAPGCRPPAWSPPPRGCRRSRSPRAPRPGPPRGRPGRGAPRDVCGSSVGALGGWRSPGARASIQARTRSATSSRRGSSRSVRTAAQVARATGRRSRSMASNSPGAGVR